MTSSRLCAVVSSSSSPSSSSFSSETHSVMTTLPPEQSQSQHDTDVMCRYPSKKCWNLRALKRNGEHHNLCDFHRQKANKNQRRLELKRKARAQGSSDLALGDKKRLRALKDTSSTRARRAPLSAHLAMKEEASAKQQQKQEAEVNRATAVSGLTSWFLQDLVLLDGVYDRAGFQVKDELPLATAASMSPIPFIELTHPPDAVDVETLAHILADAQGDACKSLEYATSGLDVPVSMYEGKTSPVDVGESWDSLDLGAASWLPVDQPSVNFDASAFVMDEDMFVADV